MIEADFLVYHAGQLVTLKGPPGPRRGPISPSSLSILPDGAMAARAGRIVWTGPTDSAAREVGLLPSAAEQDAGGRVVTPGWVDSHTHPVFHGTRQEEFAMRAAGADYEEIAGAGGGILNSVRRTRLATSDQLESTMLLHASNMLRFGTTTLEAKSGYGLDLDSELRSLEAIASVSRSSSQTILATFMGAHEVPEEYRGRPDAAADYLAYLVDTVLPVVKERGLARFVDIFCEKGVFSPEQSRWFLERASAMGFELRMHADEFHDSGGAALAAELGALSADHLLCVSNAGIRALASSATVATLLPGTAFFLGKPYPPARELLDAGAAVALATDFNPGSCFCESMPFMVSLAVCQVGMTIEEALVAATVNGAAALGVADTKGSLEPGKDADFVIWNLDDYRSIAYHLAVPDVEAVYTSAQQAVPRASGRASGDPKTGA
ncbi:imidazolonepropionase [Candidatus Fermentibacterales bacterium]|nr:imidazolonepropionase [Candidatus Fermentibacterales bacterium]